MIPKSNYERAKEKSLKTTPATKDDFPEVFNTEKSDVSHSRGFIPPTSEEINKNKVKAYHLKLKEKFTSKVNTKNSWGKNEILELFNSASNEVLLDLIM